MSRAHAAEGLAAQGADRAPGLHSDILSQVETFDSLLRSDNIESIEQLRTMSARMGTTRPGTRPAVAFQTVFFYGGVRAHSCRLEHGANVVRDDA